MNHQQQGTRDLLISWGLDVLERLRVMVIAGIFVGVLVGGLASRLAMGLLRVTSGDRVHGVTSDDGFIVGRVTLGGTYGLLMLGAVVGIVGVAAYRAVAPWLIGPRWFRRFTTAAASGVVVGSMLLHADGVDFTVLEPTWLAVGLFVGLPALFGAVIGPVVDRVAASGSWTASRPWSWVLPVSMVALFPAVTPVVAVAVAVLVIWVPIKDLGIGQLGQSAAVRLVIRAGWLAVAVAGLVAAVRDIEAIA